jgi:Phage capsid family
MKTLDDDLRAIHQQAQGLLTQVQQEDRELSDEEQQQLDQWDTEMKALDQKRQARAKTAQLLSRFGPAPPSPALPAITLPAHAPVEFTAGQEFAAAFHEMKMARNGRWTAPPIELKATLLAPTGGVSSCTLPPPPIPGVLPGTLLTQWIPSGPVSGGMIPYIKETTPWTTDAAAPVAGGVAKPESTIDLELVNQPLIKIAHWIPVEDQFLDDLDGLRSYVDSRLAFGVIRAVENEIINGPGTAGRLMGFIALPGKVAAVAVPPTARGPLAKYIMDQMAAIQGTSWEIPDAIVMHPSTWSLVITDTSSAGGFYLCCTALQSGAEPMLWGLRVILSPLMPAGTILVGAFRTASFLFRKGGPVVQATNSHADHFARNLTAIRAEVRVALVVWRPQAFGLVTGATYLAGTEAGPQAQPQAAVRGGR